MSEENRTIGQALYGMGDVETRKWFERQWAMWPDRADPRLTTNLSLHYGGVIAYRQEHGREPAMSGHFRANVEYLDRMRERPDAQKGSYP